MRGIISKVHSFNENQRILVEKISALIHSKNSSWFQGIKTSLKPPLEIKISHSKVEKEGLISPIKENGRFVNFIGEHIWLQFFETLRLLFSGTFLPTTHLQDVKSLTTTWEPLSRSIAPEITWLGHAMVLIQVANFNLLLDPAFHFCPPCFKRHTEAGIPLDKLPLIDAIALSHSHADHCEPKAVEFLSQMQPFAFVPKHLDSWMRRQGCLEVKDNVWWEQTTLERDGKKIVITSVPAQHGSQQSLTDGNITLWHGFVIQAEGKTIYFSGDTGLRENLFEQIREVFGEIDLAFLPIAPEREQSMHLNCEEALIALERLGAKKMIPIHWGAYRQAQEVLEDPINRLRGLLDGRYQHLKSLVHVPKIGERLSQDKLFSDVQEARTG